MPAIPKWRLVSRDQANGFAETVSQALPHATQVADRYHLIQNLRDHLQQFLDRKRTCLPFVEDTPLESKEASPGGKESLPSDHLQTDREIDPSNLISSERKNIMSRKKRLACYEEVMALHREGQSQREISRQLHAELAILCSAISPRQASLNERRVRDYEALGQANEGPYLPYLRDQWDAGNNNGAHLFGLIKERGYTGCESMLRGRLSEWRAELPKQRWRGNPTFAPPLHTKEAETPFLACSLLPHDFAA